jgi:hypothetical protein
MIQRQNLVSPTILQKNLVVLKLSHCLLCLRMNCEKPEVCRRPKALSLTLAITWPRKHGETNKPPAEADQVNGDVRRHQGYTGGRPVQA